MDMLNVVNKDAITIVTLNRPLKRNALNNELIVGLTKILQQEAQQNHCRVLMLRGEGEHFCAGADIGWMQEITNGSYNENYDEAQYLADLMYQLYSFPKPTVALAQGVSLGGGLGLLAACDIAIAAKNAQFGFSEVKIGLTPSTISPYVIAAIGERAAHYYFLTGERFDAEEANRIHLVHRVVAEKDLLSAGKKIANQLLQNSPHALTAAKQLIRQVAKEKITDHLTQKTAEHLANVRSTKDAREGLDAFMEKRSPKWE